MFILLHFEGRQKLFPRKMSTALSQGKHFTVYNEKQILDECIKANFVDCRNAYPVLLDDDIVAGIQAPNIIFIDIDLTQGLQRNNSEHSLSELNRTLNTIKKRLNGFSSTLLWTGNTILPKQYQWIERRLLHTPISDHRKIIDLVLSPYFAVIKHLSFDDTYLVIKDWLIKCNSLTILKPSVGYLDNKVKTAIYRSMSNGIPPIKKENMQNKYPDWHNDFKEWMIFD